MRTTKNPFGTPEEIRAWRERWRLVNQSEIDERKRESPDEKLRALDRAYAFAKAQGLLGERVDEVRRPVLPIE